MPDSLEFFNAWVADHVSNEEFAEGKEFAAKRLAPRFVDDANTAGFSFDQLEDTVGDIEKALLEILSKREEAQTPPA